MFNRSRVLSAVCLSALAALQLLSGAAFGQELEEVIVTAERRELNLQQTPISVTAFNQLELDRLGLQNAEDIANFIPNVSVGTAFGAGDSVATFSIRGAGQFRNTTFFDRGVGLYIDEMYYPRNAGAILRVMDRGTGGGAARAPGHAVRPQQYRRCNSLHLAEAGAGVQRRRGTHRRRIQSP